MVSRSLTAAWCCPDLRSDWTLGPSPDGDGAVLRAQQGSRSLRFSVAEGVALQYFTGNSSLAAVQARCERQMGTKIGSDFVAQLVTKLIAQGVIPTPTAEDDPWHEPETPPVPTEVRPKPETVSTPPPASGSALKPETVSTPSPASGPALKSEPVSTPPPASGPALKSEPVSTPPPASGPALKPEVECFAHPDGHWILRNRDDFAFLQIDALGKAICDDLGKLPLPALAQRHGVTRGELMGFLQLLANTGMLAGTAAAPPGRPSLSLASLLFSIWPLWNPDAWLTRWQPRVNWLFWQPVSLGLLAFLGLSGALALARWQEILTRGFALWQAYGWGLLLPLVALMLLVVSLHELSHAFALKHYGGTVPEIGVMLMCLMPAAYTDTTDAYCLVKRRQRVVVVAAGVLCQLFLAALGFWLWRLAASGTWLQTSSYLLMAASLLTVTVNLNPLARFDGYYLAVALTGINNLRSRSFDWYKNLLTRQPVAESGQVSAILAIYAPLSLVYLTGVFGLLLFRILDWSLMNVLYALLTLLALWLIVQWGLAGSPPAVVAAPAGARAAAEPAAAPPAQRSNSAAAPAMAANAAPPAASQRPESQRSNPAKSARAASAAPPAAAKQQAEPRQQSWSGWRWLVVVGALVALALVPTPFEVGGPVELAPRSPVRAWVRPLQPGVVTEILVEAGEQVNAGQVVARLRSPQLEQELATLARELSEARQESETLEVQEAVTRAELVRAQAQAQALGQQADRALNRVQRLRRGELTPELRELEAERLAAAAELIAAEQEAERAERLAKSGAIPTQELEQAQAAVKVARQERAARAAQLAAAMQGLRDRTDDLAAEMDTVTATVEASEDVLTVQTELQAVQGTITALLERQAQLEGLQASLTLRAPLSGTVLTRDLSLVVGSRLEAGADLLEIAALAELTATVTIREEDMRFVAVGQAVVFRPRADKLARYEATVAEILPQLAEDELGNRRVAAVQIVVVNPDGELKPNASGYAKIWSEWIPLYHRVGREILRLVPVERWLP